ncbi:Interferon-stimulated 20 kDa exonuclease-like 2 [Heterocephalus glaber]|uniref:Interferon-stimulated 20 kDa exonuclease-like 2 n=1 Tax=Heterocephalus glaber TaxID=10181 RepID=G5BW35_HETGA|nr:Interferon-stimulated 20 kDa exonuclease-like 2 [Heterocephalus glaber]
MSALLLNLDFAECPPKKSLEGNAKHRNFVKRQQFLEQRGFLNKKNQCPSKPCPIVDYRTRWSGIRKHHMLKATPFKTAWSQILKILSGKVVVGHANHNDFKAPQYFHPKPLTRDTSQIPLLNRKASCPENATMSLKTLTKKLLGWDIQAGKSGHSSVEDAQATMELYKLVEVEWEHHLAQNLQKN